MDLPMIHMYFVFFLITSAIICTVIGSFITRLTWSPFTGFISLLSTGLILLLLILSWYKEKIAETYIGTIPYLINVLSVVIIFLIYLAAAGLFFRKISMNLKDS
ncbi:putative membrane protein [Peribacillus deserti]|uniref:Membrane protein n=1 Tax=Peribacillus deserti TaxID=673318 RepID=A0ABS2QFF0_9BACI|nr:hypothetical protein [Peribacillus deserti]MBM7691429.1 putative membrane protein [Peribacillus deserti]